MPKNDKPTWPRRLWRITRSVLIIYLLVLLVLSLIQTSLIFPGAATQGTPDANVIAPPGTQLISLKTDDGTAIKALFATALQPDRSPFPDPAARPSIIFFYGNGMCLAQTVQELEMFRRLGANVIVPEYVGYGLAEGSPSEEGCYQSATAAYNFLVKEKNFKPETIIAAGWSLGGAVAIDLAARKQVGGVATFSAFTSLVDMARNLYPIFPVDLILKHRFESEKKIPRIDVPILIGHSTSDSMIPYSMSHRLASAARGPVTRLDIPGDHNQFFDAADDLLPPAMTALMQTVQQRALALHQ